jgi:hypothetical protein
MAKKPELPPSLSGVPGWSDMEIEDEKRLRLLEEAINGLPPMKEVTESGVAEAARWLLNEWRSAVVNLKLEKKSGTASQVGVQGKLGQIASRSRTLLKTLKGADRAAFDAWTAVAHFKDGLDREAAKQEWLQLKQLLEFSAERAKKAAEAAQVVIKHRPEAGSKGGRPPDRLGDSVAIMAALVYQELTGAPASRVIDGITGKPRGGFFEFLGRVFEALGIGSSPNAANARLQERLGKKP